MKAKSNVNWRAIIECRKMRYDAIYLEIGTLKKTLSQWCEYFGLLVGKTEEEKKMIKIKCSNRYYSYRSGRGGSDDFFIIKNSRCVPPIPGKEKKKIKVFARRIKIHKTKPKYSNRRYKLNIPSVPLLPPPPRPVLAVPEGHRKKVTSYVFI